VALLVSLFPTHAILVVCNSTQSAPGNEQAKEHERTASVDGSYNTFGFESLVGIVAETIPCIAPHNTNFSVCEGRIPINSLFERSVDIGNHGNNIICEGVKKMMLWVCASCWEEGCTVLSGMEKRL